MTLFETILFKFFVCSQHRGNGGYIITLHKTDVISLQKERHVPISLMITQSSSVPTLKNVIQ